VSAYSAQEELDQLKTWWKNYGASIVVGVTLGAVLLFGYRYWSQHVEATREAASALYDQLIDAARANKPEAGVAGEKLMHDYASTPYAGMGVLVLARQAHLAGDRALARQHLEWALAHAADSATQHAARLHLARLLLDLGELQAVTPLLEVKDVAGFEAEYLELKGDVAVKQGEKDAARTAYRAALEKLGQESPYRSVVSMKLDDLGTEKPQ